MSRLLLHRISVPAMFEVLLTGSKDTGDIRLEFAAIYRAQGRYERTEKAEEGRNEAATALEPYILDSTMRNAMAIFDWLG